MFNLIISIIAIALVVALAGASLYYGGAAFNQGNADAKSSTMINQAQQIQSAVLLYKANEGGEPEQLSDLLGVYIKGEPELPVGNGDLKWALLDGSDLNNPAPGNPDTVALLLPITPKAELGITREMCKTINSDGAGVVFCTAGDSSLSAIKAKGSTDEEVDTFLGDGNKAVIHMGY
ncbi:hypothetical protein [Vibrio owensii]|uniref:hypothetical protein n=1 Tax=Vibrio harveyi group TaxID=717610 RepID=UPI003CC667D4